MIMAVTFMSWLPQYWVIGSAPNKSIARQASHGSVANATDVARQ